MKKKGLNLVLVLAAVIFMIGGTSGVVFARSRHCAKTPSCVKKQTSCRQDRKCKKTKYCRQTAHHSRAKVKIRKGGSGHHYDGHSRSHSHH